jgi:threonine dehydrogenase-like Zn-dependent dehydrogenase
VRALWLEDGALRLLDNLAVPQPGPGDALVRVITAGVCSTDTALMEGMYGFTGVPGHEFVGIVESGPAKLYGRRVVGEINVACGACSACQAGRRKHCESRSALGIRGRHGAFAEFLVLPAQNLHPVPDGVSTEAAAFTEPLAAALDVFERADVVETDRILVVGDGKLAQLVCRVLALTGADVDVLGRHRRKLDRLEGIVANSFHDGSVEARAYDLAIECTGNPSGLVTALESLRPRGTLVMKSTYPEMAAVDGTRIVVDELRLVGSRCGPFTKALDLLDNHQVDPTPLIDARYPLAGGVEALRRSRERGVLKVLIDAG